MKILAVVFALFWWGMGAVRQQATVEGTLSPVGAPVGTPLRVSAGSGCVVDLVQRYSAAGGLSGRMEIDYRILVHGSCGSPAGTYDEEWIARGTFTGSLADDSTSGSFVYTGEVRDGGEVSGRMEFDQGLEGELVIHGRFSDGSLTYSGSLRQGRSVHGG